MNDLIHDEALKVIEREIAKNAEDKATIEKRIEILNRKVTDIRRESMKIETSLSVVEKELEKETGRLQMIEKKDQLLITKKHERQNELMRAKK